MAAVPVYGSIIGAGTAILVSADINGAFTVTRLSIASVPSATVPVHGFIGGAGSFLSINVDSSGAYTIARDSFSGGTPVPVYGFAAGEAIGIRITDNTGILGFSLRFPGGAASPYSIIGTKFGPNGGGSGTGVAGDASHVAGTSRFRIDMPSYDVVLNLVEYWNGRISFNSAGEIVGANDINVKAGWEPDGGSSVIPLPFSGARTATIAPGARLRCDRQSILVPGGSKPWIRSYVSVTAGNTWPVNRIAHNSGFGESENTFGTGAGTDQVDVIGTFGNATATYAFGPCGIYGVPADGLRRKCVALFQDSIGTVSGEDGSPNYGDANGYAGYLERAIGSTYATTNAARATSRLQWVAPGFANQVALIAPFVTSAIIELSCNDWSTGRSLAQMQADLATIVGALQAFGVVVFVCTSTPKPLTTSNGWLDGGTSINGAADAVRVGYNSWLMTATPPLGIRKVFDVAGAVGDPGRPGYWLPNNPALTLDGTHLLSAGRALAVAAVDLNALV